jgi:hypothetical protein
VLHVYIARNMELEDLHRSSSQFREIPATD